MPQVCASEEAARILHLKAGMALDWAAWGRPLHSILACIQRTDSVRMTARFEFVFSPGSLDGFPAMYYGSVRVKPRDVAAMQRAIYEKMPTITVVNMADVLEIVQKVVDQISLVVRFVSAFTIVAGAIILASSVAGTRFRTGARSGDPENAGRDAPPRRRHFLDGVSGAGRSGWIAWQRVGHRLYRAGGEASAEGGVSLRPGGGLVLHCADRAGGRGGGMAGELSHFGAEAAGGAAG